MSKSCDEVKSMLSSYIDDMLSEKEAKAVAEHLSVCGDCRREYDFLAGVVQCAGSMPVLSVSQSFHNSLHEKLVAVEQKPVLSKKKPIWQRTSSFAAAAAVIALSVVTFSHLPKQSELTPVVPTPGLTQKTQTEEPKVNNLDTPQPTQVAERIADSKHGQQQKNRQSEELSPQHVVQQEPTEGLNKEQVFEGADTTESASIPEAVANGDEPNVSDQQPVSVAALLDEPASAYEPAGDDGSSSLDGATARFAAPTVKHILNYIFTTEGYEQAAELVKGHQQAEDAFLIPNNELDAVSQRLEALPGYVSKQMVSETINEPTDEQQALYVSSTFIVIFKNQ